MAITKRHVNESYETVNEATYSFSVRLSPQPFIETHIKRLQLIIITEPASRINLFT
jgi:hypothetical protein